MRYLYVLALAITILTACKKQGDQQPQPLEDAPNSGISRIRYYFVDKTYFEATYSYNREGLLSKINYLDSLGTIASIDYQYYTDTRLDSSVTVDRSNTPINKNYYIYQNNKLITIKHFEQGIGKKLELYYERTITYIGSVLYKTEDVNTYNPHNTYTIYTYSNGNVSDIKIYKTATNELLENTVYEYDTNPNPYYNKPYTNRYNVINNMNNVVLEKLVYAKEHQTGQVKYKYTYNTQGFPLIQYIEATNNKLIAEQEFFYYAQP